MQDHIKNYDHDITSENDCKEILRQLESDHLMFLVQNFSEKELKAGYLFLNLGNNDPIKPTCNDCYVGNCNNREEGHCCPEFTEN